LRFKVLNATSQNVAVFCVAEPCNLAITQMIEAASTSKMSVKFALRREEIKKKTAILLLQFMELPCGKVC
jgi:hypothetical protein